MRVKKDLFIMYSQISELLFYTQSNMKFDTWRKALAAIQSFRTKFKD
jgi:hypothetical protein